MTRSKKIIIGIFSLLPLVLFLCYMGTIISLILSQLRDGYSDDYNFNRFEDTRTAVGIVISAILMGLVSLGALIYFIVHAVNNAFVKQDERIIWIILFVFVGMIVFPIYWYLKVWKQPEELPGQRNFDFEKR
jgi:di/tricarboxylate transporter